MERIIGYKTFDGRIFENAEEAIIYEKKCEFENKLARIIEKNIKDKNYKKMVEDINKHSYDVDSLYKPPFVKFVGQLIIDNVVEFAEIFKEISNEQIV